MSDNDLDLDDAKNGASPILEDLKKQTSETAGSVKDALGSMATEARAKLSDILDRQKSAGVDQLTSFVRAVRTAAGELDGESPQTARLVRITASWVDRFAVDMRSKNVPDLLASVTAFARQQPATIFAGSVLVGFVLARFLKSDASVKRPKIPLQSGYGEWSAAHREDATV